MMHFGLVETQAPAAPAPSASDGLEASERSLRCPQCGAGPFGTEGELQEHIEAVHGNQQ